MCIVLLFLIEQGWSSHLPSFIDTSHLCPSPAQLPFWYSQLKAALFGFKMRLLLFQAILLALACCAVGDKELSISMPPHPGVNQFPAGLPKPSNPYLEKYYVAPPVPANHYRGTYVSSVVDSSRSN